MRKEKIGLETLSERKLKEVVKYAVLFCDIDGNFSAAIVNSEKQVANLKGFGDYAGASKVNCIIPSDL